MNTCRICLEENAQKDIYQMRYDMNTSYVDLMLFCLNIKIFPDTKTTSHLCMKCTRKLISFYKFKQLALKNNEYLLGNSQQKAVIDVDETEVFTIKNEHSKDELITHEYISYNAEVKEEKIDIIVGPLKEELDGEVFNDHDGSDDELLNIIKQNKTEKDTNNVEKFEKGKKSKLHSKICEECGKAVKDLKLHMRVHQPVDKRTYYECKLCPQKYATANARSKHFKMKHLNFKMECGICKKEVGDLKRHMILMHDKQNLPFACEECGKRCLTKAQLKMHVGTHSQEKLFQCDVCQSRYRTKLSLQLHKRRVHDKEKPHMCQYCSKRFFKKDHLQSHIRSHTGERPCKCPECGKHFHSTTTLRKHQLIHANDRKFVCDSCDRAFISRTGLLAHMISHTKIKRYPCSYCDVKFGRSDHRRRHERTAHLNHYNWPEKDVPPINIS